MGLFKQALGYGALEQIAIRVLDFFTLWIVLHTLPEADLADYGVATGMLFLFYAILITPENALLRERNKWTEAGDLREHLKGFLLFAQLRVLFIAGITGIAAWQLGTHHVYFYACVFPLIIQTIQIAEIARIEFRADLRQKTVLATEFPLKLLLLFMTAFLFLAPTLINYLLLYLVWAAISAWTWLHHLQQHHGVWLNLEWMQLKHIRGVMGEFSIWQHLSWLVTCIVFNIDPWVLTWFSTDTAIVATYTVALKVATMFFLIPTFMQLMTGILLLNSSSDAQRHRVFRRMFHLNLIVSLTQFLTFIMLGEWIGYMFRGEELDTQLFSEIGFILNIGGLALNLARPLIADLTLHASLHRLLFTVYLPVLAVGAASYLVLTYWFGPHGCAMASALSYLAYALLLLGQSSNKGVARPALLYTGLLRS